MMMSNITVPGFILRPRSRFMLEKETLLNQQLQVNFLQQSWVSIKLYNLC